MKGTSKSRSGALRKLAKGGGRGIPIAALGAVAATALGAYVAHRTARYQTRFGLSAAPSHQAVGAGSPARYRISISRQGFRGAVDLSVTGTPRDAQPQLTGGGNTLRMLTVVTSGRTPTGRYRLLVRARAGAYRNAIRLVLTIHAPNAVPVGITGTVSGLEPGLPQPLDLALRNASAEYLWVTVLTVTATGLSAPRSSALLPCTLADFSIRQFSGIYPVVLPPSSTRTLSGLSVPSAERPQVMLLDRPRNQDGCQGATVAFAYSAKGVTL
jgi:hypothetical protein